MNILQVFDRLVPYDTFLDDLSARIVRLMKNDSNDPEFISQRKAFEMFGRGNVERWRHQGRVIAFRRPGKVEYRTADLRLLQRTEQDYFNNYPTGNRHSCKDGTDSREHDGSKSR